MKEVKRSANAPGTSEDLRGESGTDAAACVARGVRLVVRAVQCVASTARLLASAVL
jgi:hypothetical protein